MNFNVTIDWKFVVALGASAVGIIFAMKMNSEQAERVSVKAIDALEDYAEAEIACP